MTERYPKDHLRPLLLVVDRVGGPPAHYPRVEVMGRRPGRASARQVRGPRRLRVPGFIGSDKLRLCKVVPNLYVELRQSVLGVRVREDIQMKGFRAKIGPNLDMGVP